MLKNGVSVILIKFPSLAIPQFSHPLNEDNELRIVIFIS